VPKELFEINMFNRGTICNPSQTDIPTEASSNSLNIDPIAEDGKLKGIPENTKIEDNCGHDNNTLLQNITDPSKHDLISYKNSDNNVYKLEDLYSGSGTESSLGALTNATDGKIAMQSMNGSVYLGQGTAVGATPQWIGRLDHGQFGAAETNSLVMEEDSIDPPNMYNETTTACTDGEFIYSCYGGGHGTYSEDSANDGASGTENAYSTLHASGEITKIRISDGKVIARSSIALGYVNGICVSSDQSRIIALCSEKWLAGSTTKGLDLGNSHTIVFLSSSNLEHIKTHTTNLNTYFNHSTNPAGTSMSYWNMSGTVSDGDDDGNDWEDEDSYWDGPLANYSYQGTFSDIFESDSKLWVCTSSAAVFNVSHTDYDYSDEIAFSDRTPLGLGYHKDTVALTEEYMDPGGTDAASGGWYADSDGAWCFPSCHNASFLEVTGSDNHIGLFFRNGQEAGMTFKYGLGSVEVEKTGIVLSISDSATARQLITGGSVRLFTLGNESPTEFGVREINNMMYKSPKGLNKVAYSWVKNWSTSAMEVNIREFDCPAYDASHATTVITTTEVTGDDTYQVPIRITDTEIIGLVSDAFMSISDGNGASADDRNKYRTMSKWTDDGGWARTDLGSKFYISQRAPGYQIKETDVSSGFHVNDYGYFYRFSFVYDGFQESPLGASMNIWSNGKTVRVPFIVNTDNIPARVTALRVYRATSVSASNRSIGGFYHYLGEIDIVEYNPDSVIHPDNTYSDGVWEDGSDNVFNEGEEVKEGIDKPLEYMDNGPVGATYETMSGLFEAMTDSNVQYSLSTQLNDSLFIADCEHHSHSNARNYIYKSLPYKPSLINWAVDLLKLPEIPTAIQAYNGRVYAFSEGSTYRIEPNALFTEDVFTGAGCLGPDAVSTSDFGMCYCDNYNIYLNTGGVPIPIGDTILTSDDNVGYLDLLNTSTFSPKIGFDSRRKSFVVFVTKSKAWSYNIVRKTWNLWEYGDADNTEYAKGILQGKKGEILLARHDDSDLYDMFSSATRKVWSWTSKRISMQSKTQRKKFYEAIVTYTGDGSGDAPTVDVYWDYATGTTTTSAGTSESNIIRRNLGNTANSIQKRLIKVKLTAGDATTEVDSIGITFRRFIKLTEQGNAI
jgi:hypothetical protein